MTVEEAIIIIGNIPINGDECYSISEYQQAKAMAIEALQQESDAEFMCKVMSKTVNKSTDDRNFIGGC